MQVDLKFKIKAGDGRITFPIYRVPISGGTEPVDAGDIQNLQVDLDRQVLQSSQEGVMVAAVYSNVAEGAHRIVITGALNDVAFALVYAVRAEELGVPAEVVAPNAYVSLAPTGEGTIEQQIKDLQDRMGTAEGEIVTITAALSDMATKEEVQETLDKILEAIKALPDGQAVSAQVALNTAAIEGLQGDVSQLGQQVIYDVTMNNSNHPTFASLLALLSDANLSTLIPANVRCGGMSIRFVQTSDNKYVQFRYMGTDVTGNPNPFLDTANWQGVDDEPTAGSDNLVKSGGIFDAITNVMKQENTYDDDECFELYDKKGNLIFRIKGGITSLTKLIVDSIQTGKIDLVGKKIVTTDDLPVLPAEKAFDDSEEFIIKDKIGNPIVKFSSRGVEASAFYDENGRNITESSVSFDSYAQVKFSDFKNNSITDSEAIELAIQFLMVANYRTLVIDEDVHIDRAILIPSNFTLELQADIYQNDYVFDNVIRSANVVFPSDANWGVQEAETDPNRNRVALYPADITELTNIKIVGNNHYLYKCENPKIGYNPIKQTNEPMVADDWGSMVFICMFTNCKQVEIDGLKLRRSQSYNIEFDLCQYVKISNLDIVTPAVNSNLDGIDIRNGNKHFFIEHIYAETGDDALALDAGYTTGITFPLKNRYLYPLEGGWNYMEKIFNKDQSLLDIEDIHVDDYQYKKVDTDGSRGCILLVWNGRKIHDVTINNFKELDGSLVCDMVIYLYTTSSYGSSSPANSIYNVRINDVISKSAVCVLKSNMKCANIWANKLVPKVGGSVYQLSYSDGFTITNS